MCNLCVITRYNSNSEITLPTRVNSVCGGRGRDSIACMIKSVSLLKFNSSSIICFFRTDVQPCSTIVIKLQNIIIIYNYIHCYIASNQYGTIYKNQLETISILKKSKKYTPTDFQNTLYSIIFWHLQMRHSVANPVCVTGEIVLDSIQQ